ncbi:hypothetical protein CJ739_2170 [Mariniflexile rhizosphaerae]|uniref:hypothetical protein n=1 Tax=unclassified Mariniflexile TaxID=2643887 RepID=UPI000CB2F868|nr:hypothetical protein [Mariniflexile sp. TRM1-10]AXP81251.1 hypothetical protein CJ739_2170 [Mariniflexile sp. TRM1-10]PLB18136.1 MAG: hypothetical protein TRG1_3055 [Flavobacteriaceae bacterium FS1-H7996/R]
MHKKLLQIIILTLITSCGSTKNTTDLIADEKFELCSEIKYNRLVTEVGPIEGKLIYKQNIHSLLENSLIQEKYLTEISINGYSELLQKANRKEIKPEFFEKFKTDSNYLIDALSKIPEDKFQLIMYRKLFLDLIYTQLN